MDPKTPSPEVAGYFMTLPEVSLEEITKNLQQFAQNYLFNQTKATIKKDSKYIFGVFFVKSTDNPELTCIAVQIKQKTPNIQESVHMKSDRIVIEIEKQLRQQYNEKNFEMKILNLGKANIGDAIRELLSPLVQTISQVFDVRTIFYRGVIELGLSEEKKIRTKKPFEKVLESLENLLKIDQKTILKDQHFYHLCKKLNSRNFKPNAKETVDLRIKLLKLIIQLKENGQKIHEKMIEEEFEFEKGFLTREKSIFIKEIDDFDVELLRDPRNLNISGFLKLAINDRIEYLILKNELVPDLVTSLDVEEVFNHFLLEKTINELKEEILKTEKTCLELAKSTDESVVQESVNFNYKLLDQRQKLEYLLTKSRMCNECQFQDLVSILGTKAKVMFSSMEQTISKVIDVGEKHLSESLVTDIIKILQNSSSTSLNLPSKFFEHLKKSTKKEMIKLVQDQKIKDSQPLMNFLVTILVEDADEDARSSALLTLQNSKFKLSEEVKALITIEGCCSNHVCLLSKLLDHVNLGYRLTYKCFETLQATKICRDKVKIIQMIVDNDQQRLPTFFVTSIKNELVHQSWDVDLINDCLVICQTMIARKYLKISELNNDLLVQCIKDQRYQENALLMVYSAFQQGEAIQDAIKDLIMTLPTDVPIVANCVKALTLRRAFGDELNNSRSSIEEKRNTMKKMVEGEFNDNPAIRSLMNLIRFEPELRDEAFGTFVKMITQDTWKTNAKNFRHVMQSMKDSTSPTSFDAVRKLSSKNFIDDFDVIIDYLIYRMFTTDTRVQKDAIIILKDIFIQKRSDIDPWIPHLCEIMNLSRSKEVKLAILNMIKETSKDADLLKPLEVTLELIQINSDNFKEKLLLELLDTVERGYIVSDVTVNDLILLLLRPNFEHFDLVSNVLLSIHLRQTLNSESFQKLIAILNETSQRFNVDIVTLLIEALHMSNAFTEPSPNILEQLLNACSSNNSNDSKDSKLMLMILEFVRLYILKFHEKIPRNDKLIKILRETCLNDHTDQSETIIKMKISFEILPLIEPKIFSDESFIAETFKQLKYLLNLEIKELNEFMSNKTKSDRVQVLYVLALTNMCNHQLNPEIIVEKADSDWVKEMLSDILVKAVFQQSGQFDELSLQSFLRELSNLDEFLVENHLTKVEQMLMKVIQDRCADSFESLIDIFKLLEDEKSLKIFMDNQLTFEARIEKMKELHLTKLLPTLRVEELQEVIHLRSSTLEKLLGTHFEANSTDDLKQFLKRVNDTLEPEDQDSFLNDISNLRSVFEWNGALNKELVDTIFIKKQIIVSEEVTKSKLDLLGEKLIKILASGWNVSSIQVILDRIIDTNGLDVAITSLDSIYEYQLKEYDSDVRGETILDTICERPVQSWDKTFHDIAIYQTFTGTYQKPLNQLIQEIETLNNDQKVKYFEDKSNLQKEYEKVMQSFNNHSTFETSGPNKKISEYDPEMIKQWASSARGLFGRKNFIYEAVAVTVRAVKITYGFLPRDIQLLSLLCVLNTAVNKGRLMQINTGEGKTIIIAMFAVIKVLQGHSVDVITSSEELAKPQSIEMTPFYSLFDLTVSHNAEDPEDIKSRYQRDILYGAADAFQGDILRDEFNKMGTRNGRKSDVAIVDEVDSMLIDGKNHIVMLSSMMPAMNYLEPILAAIYMHIGLVANTLVVKDGKTYFIDHQDRTQDDGTMRDDVIDNLIELNVTKIEFIKKNAEKHIRKVLRDTEGLQAFPEEEREIPKGYTKLSIPAHLYELVTRVQLPKWIDSAIHAMFKSEINKHYILTEDGKVAPVDATNTGVIQQNMHWNNGLHQFLQIKHGAKITPENLTTNFISNVTFFKRYGANLYGLTGTLGSSDSMNLLNNTYSVDSVIIPPFKQKQHRELAAIIVSNEEDWYTNIIESTLQKLRHKRGVLIIARYIDQVNELHERLKAKYDSTKIKIYKTQKESSSVRAKLQSGEVIIATNIAGRGTDIKPSATIETNGGLHVCVTFLPKNKRVEEQNVGRTSRKGNRGTSQFILLESKGRDMKKLRSLRNIEETQSLKRAETEMNIVCSKDIIFHEFCKFLNNFRKEDIRIVEERFGIWLQMNIDKFTNESNETLHSLFQETFVKNVLKDNPEKLIKNICFHVTESNNYLKSKKYDEAIDECTNAILKDDQFAEHAFYNRAYCRIAKYGSSSSSNEKSKEQIELAISDFKAARKIINHRLLELQIIQKASDGLSLSEQVKNKSTLYNIQLSAIKQAIGLDRDEASLELKDLIEHKTKAEQMVKKLKDQLSQENSEELRQELENVKSNLKKIYERKHELEKEMKEDIGGVIGKTFRDKYDIQIELLEIENSLPPDEDIQYFTQEIDEFKNNGLIGSFNISELKPIPWSQVFWMAFIGLVQIAAGALLTVFCAGPGTSLGISLMLEGINDLVVAVRDGIINRNIDWKNWAIQKAISLTVGLVLCGFGGIKDAVKTVYTGIKTVAKGAVISAVKTGVVKEGLKLAVKNAGLQLGKGVALEMTTALVSEGIERACMDQIEKHLSGKLHPNIKNALEGNANVTRLLTIDLSNRNRYFQSLIISKALKILTPQNTELGVQEIGKMFATRIASAKIKGLGMGIQLFEVGEAIVELVQFEKKFLRSLNASIEKIMKDHKKRIDESESKKTSNHKTNVQTESQFENHASRNLETDTTNDDIDLDKAQTRHEHASLQSGYVSTTNACDIISERVANAMTNIIKGKIVMPVTHVATNFTMDKITSGVQSTLAHKTQQYKNYRMIDSSLSGVFDHRRALKSRGNEVEKNKQEANKEVSKLQDGGEAGIIHIHAISENINRKIVIYDASGNVWKVINKHLSGASVKVEYHPPVNGSVAHWTLPGKREPRDYSGPNNCLFDCIAEQTSKNANELRFATVATMNRNIERYALVMPEIKQVTRYKSQWLMYGGQRTDLPDGGYKIKASTEELVTQANKGKRKNNEKRMEKAENLSVDKISQKLNKDGRLLSRTVKATITKEHIERGRTPGSISSSKEAKESMAQAGQERGFDRGHIVAASHGGTNHHLNIIPMLAKMNRSGGPYYTREQEIRESVLKNNYSYISTYKITFGTVTKGNRSKTVPKSMTITSEIRDKENVVIGERLDIVDFVHNKIIVKEDVISGGQKTEQPKRTIWHSAYKPTKRTHSDIDDQSDDLKT